MSKAMRTMTLDEVRTTFDSGGLTGAQIIAHGRRFHVTADTRTGERVILVKYTGRTPRPIADPTTAIKMLYDIGFKVVTVEMSDWQPEQVELKLSQQQKESTT